jgi:hypothetical protein
MIHVFTLPRRGVTAPDASQATQRQLIDAELGLAARRQNASDEFGAQSAKLDGWSRRLGCS